MPSGDISLVIVLGIAWLVILLSTVTTRWKTRLKKLPKTVPVDHELSYVKIITPTPEQIAANERRREMVRQWRADVLESLRQDSDPTV